MDHDQQLLPPGYRFYPTEEELISFYLHNKLHNSQGPDLHLAIPSIDIYNYDPHQLPGLAGRLCHREMEQWFFFVPQQEREARGGRPNRTTASGYWKATGSPSCVYSSQNKVIGVKKTMVFYKGRAPTGSKTKWKMNEYKVAIKQEDIVMSNADPSASSSSTTFPKVRNELSLCRVYVTSGCARAFDRRPPPAGAMSSNNATQNASDGNNQDQNGGYNMNQEQERNGADNSQNNNINVDGAAAMLMERSSSSGSSRSNNSGGNDQMTLQDQDQDQDPVAGSSNSHEIGMAEDLEYLWDWEKVNWL